MSLFQTFTAIGLLLAALSAFAPTADAADGPSPFPDAQDQAAWPGKGPIRVFPWMIDNRTWFWSQREQSQDAVVFVGDSLTGNWDGKQMAELFPKMKIANRGIGGDVSRGVLFRFQEDVLDLHPKLVVLCIGSNDLSAHADPADIIANISATIDLARKQQPELPIILCTLAPRDSAEAPTRQGAHQDINDRIRNYAKDAPNLELLDLFAVLAATDGKPVPEYFASDKLHLAAPGYVKWAEALKPLLAKAKID